jgi:hypothetical protein
VLHSRCRQCALRGTNTLHEAWPASFQRRQARALGLAWDCQHQLDSFVNACNCQPCCVARCPYYLTAEHDLYGRLPDVESPSETEYWIDLEDVQMDKAQCSNDFMSVSSTQRMRQHCTTDSISDCAACCLGLRLCCVGTSGAIWHLVQHGHSSALWTPDLLHPYSSLSL